MRYSNRNIEDWDFRECYIDSPHYDVEADLFFGSHFTHVVAIDAGRIIVIKGLVENGYAEVEDDGRHIRLSAQADFFLKGWKREASRFTGGGRFERKVVEALRRENRKYGRLRTTILPPLPGLQGRSKID